jgi:hypothetical protein
MRAISVNTERDASAGRKAASAKMMADMKSIVESISHKALNALQRKELMQMPKIAVAALPNERV